MSVTWKVPPDDSAVPDIPLRSAALIPKIGKMMIGKDGGVRVQRRNEQQKNENEKNEKRRLISQR